MTANRNFVRFAHSYLYEGLKIPSIIRFFLGCVYIFYFYRKIVLNVHVEPLKERKKK